MSKEAYNKLKLRLLRRPEGTKVDDPLSLDSNSSWFKYFEDEKVLLLIKQDLMRTCIAEYPNIIDDLTSMLLVYCKANSVSYCQGFHEILAFIYKDGEDYNEVYGKLEQALHKLLPYYTTDKTPEILAILQIVDSDLAKHLQRMCLDLNICFIRWTRVLFIHQFTNIQPIYEAFLHDSAILEYLVVILLEIHRDLLLKGRQTDCYNVIMNMSVLDNAKECIANAKYIRDRPFSSAGSIIRSRISSRK